MTTRVTATMVRFNNKAYSKKIKTEMYVDFETTQDRESIEILRLLERSGLKVFCSKKSNNNKTLDMRDIEFYVNGKFEYDVFTTTVDGEKVSVSKSVIARIFETNEEGVDPFTYKEKDWIEYFDMIA